MRFVHAIMVLIVCAIIIGIVAGAASAATKISPTAKPTVKHMITRSDLVDRSSDIPRAKYTPTAVLSVRPNVNLRHSLTLLASGKVKPTASVTPTKIARKMSNAGALRVRASAKPTVKASTKPKYLAARKVKPTASAKPTVKYLQVSPQGIKTPAQSYGIYGLGGYVPTPTTGPAVRVVRTGSPTPVPGYYTPRYPGESGAGNTVVVPSTPTTTVQRQGVPASAVSIPYAAGVKSGRGTIGTSNKVALSDDLRYAGRGPGLVDTTTVQRPATSAPAWTPGQPIKTTVVQTPASAPGPNSRPTVFVVCRTCPR